MDNIKLIEDLLDLQKQISTKLDEIEENAESNFVRVQCRMNTRHVVENTFYWHIRQLLAVVLTDRENPDVAVRHKVLREKRTEAKKIIEKYLQ